MASAEAIRVYDDIDVSTQGALTFVFSPPARASMPLAPLLLARRGYCQAVFEELAANSPRELAAIVRDSSVPSSRLTFAAETLGRLVPQPWVACLLIGVLRDHGSPLVREGAVLGLAHHLESADVAEAVRRAAESDTSPGVRQVAAEALDD